MSEVLADHINRFGSDGPDGLAFPNRAGNPMHASSFITHYWKPAKEAVGLEGFRFTTCATRPSGRSGSDAVSRGQPENPR